MKLREWALETWIGKDDKQNNDILPWCATKKRKARTTSVILTELPIVNASGGKSRFLYGLIKGLGSLAGSPFMEAMMSDGQLSRRGLLEGNYR